MTEVTITNSLALIDNLVALLVILETTYKLYTLQKL